MTLADMIRGKRKSEPTVVAAAVIEVIAVIPATQEGGVAGSSSKPWEREEHRGPPLSTPIARPGKPPRKVKVHPTTPAAEVLRALGVTVSYVTTKTQAQHELDVLLQVTTPLGVDIETAKLPEHAGDPRAGLDPYRSRIRLVQLYAGGDVVYVFDFDHVDPVLLAPLLQSKQLIAHNAVFELKHLMHAGVSIGVPDCTMLMCAVLYNRRPSLADAAARSPGLEIDKALQISDWSAAPLSEDQLAYAALDAVLAKRLAEKLIQELKARDLTLGYTLLRNVQPSVAAMELAGVPFEVARHREMALEWTAKRDEAYSLLQREVGSDLNVRSGKQLDAWLRTKLNAQQLAAWPLTRTGVLSTAENTLERAGSNPQLVACVGPLLSFKRADKLVGTYGAAFAEAVNPITGRIHANFLIAGAESGRFSCSHPNLQNQPREPGFRALFAAPPGKVLVGGDFNQIELRVAAAVSKDPVMSAAYARGDDLHVKTAAAMAGVHENQVTKEQRQAAKAVNFGLMYGMGAKTLASYAQAMYGVTMSVAEAREAKNAFFRTYPGFAEWYRTIPRKTERALKSYIPGGRQRTYAAGTNTFTRSLNTPIQGGAANVLLATLAILHNRLADTAGVRLVLHVHDELVLEADEGLVEVAKGILKGVMVEGFLIVFPEATVVKLVGVQTGRTWADVKG